MDRSIFGQIFDLGVDVLVTTLDKATGVILAQLGNSTTGRVRSDRVEWWQHAGFTSRCALPTNGGSSCQSLIIKCGDRDVIFATRDTRGTSIIGNLADGETAVYACGSQAAAYFKKDGSARLMTTDNGAEPNAKSGTPGKAVFAGVSSLFQPLTGGTPQPGGEFRWYGPWGGAWQDPGGYHLRTWHGVKIDAGGIGGLTLPGFSSGSAWTVTADTEVLDAAVLVLGRNNGTGQALLQALPVQAQLGAALEAFIAAVAAFTGTGTFPGLPAAQTAMTAAIAALTTTCATKTTTAS